MSNSMMSDLDSGYHPAGRRSAAIAGNAGNVLRRTLTHRLLAIGYWLFAKRWLLAIREASAIGYSQGITDQISTARF